MCADACVCVLGDDGGGLEGVYYVRKLEVESLEPSKCCALTFGLLSHALSAVGNNLRVAPVNKASVLHGAEAQEEEEEEGYKEKEEEEEPRLLRYTSKAILLSLAPPLSHSSPPSQPHACLPLIHGHHLVMNDFSRQILIKWQSVVAAP